jgi:hypothetical protein
MKYALTIPLLNFLMCFVIYAQNINSDLILKNEKIILLDSTLTNEKNILLYLSNDELFILNNKFKVENDEIVFDLFKYGDENNSYKIKFKNAFNNNKLYFSDFITFNNLLFLLEINHLIIYDIEKSELLNIIKLPFVFLKLNFEYPYVILSNCFLSSDNRKAESQTYIYKYNIINNKDRIKHFNNPLGFNYVIFSHMNHLDYYNNNYLLSDVTRYYVVIYNDSFDTVTSLTRNDKIWLNYKNDTNTNIKTNKIKDLASLLDEVSTFPIIHKANFIDSCKILIMYSLPDTNIESLGYSYFYDIWEKENNIWKLKYKDLVNNPIDKNSFFSPELLEVSNKYKIVSGKMIKLHAIPFIIDNSKVKKVNFLKLFDDIDSFFRNNDLRYSIFINSFIN